MNEKLQGLIPFLRIFFPELRKWIPKILIGAGIAIITGPFWAPILNAALKRYFDLSVPLEQSSIAGWILLALGLGVYFFTVAEDRRTQSKPAQPQEIADQRSLNSFFSKLSLPAFDSFFEYGHLLMTYTPVFYYYYGLKEFVEASEYHIHDEEIRAEIESLCSAMSSALSHGDYFHPTSNEKLQKFDSSRDMYLHEDVRLARENFLSSVTAAEQHMRNLCRKVKSKYPEFDFATTSQSAIADFKEYLKSQDDSEKRYLSDKENSVLHTIVFMEENRAQADLKNITRALGISRIDVQVALDSLIDREYVKHLYPGALHQKYTILKAGRDYYVNNVQQAGEID